MQRNNSSSNLAGGGPNGGGSNDGVVEKRPYHLKLVLVGTVYGLAVLGRTLTHVLFSGESNVGKSSLVERYVNNNFREFQESTIGGTQH